MLLGKLETKHLLIEYLYMTINTHKGHLSCAARVEWNKPALLCFHLINGRPLVPALPMLQCPYHSSRSNGSRWL